MKDTYVVERPSDFSVLIEDILNWSESQVNNSLVIALQGDLGAGKTTFTQELAKHLGVTESVTSPTFTIMKQYELETENFDKLVHIDAYRFESEEEAAPLRLGEILATPRTVVCIEWPEYVPASTPESAVWLEIKPGDNDVREVTVRIKAKK